MLYNRDILLYKKKGALYDQKSTLPMCISFTTRTFPVDISCGYFLWIFPMDIPSAGVDN